jgi:hypothetical protein
MNYYHMTRNHTQACHSISQPDSEPLFHSKGVSKLYLFSSNKPSSIALISVEKKCHVVSWDRKQVRADQFISEKRTERNVRRVESAQGKIPYSALSIVIFSPSKNEKGLPIMHQRRGSPISRHAPFISPSASKPQIGLRRAPASGPSILRIGSRPSPRLRICVVNHQPVTVAMENNNNK